MHLITGSSAVLWLTRTILLVRLKFEFGLSPICAVFAKNIERLVVGKIECYLK